MIYIVIPVHNNKNYTKDCLQCLQKQIYSDFKIIVVDDGSTDGTDVMIKKNYPDVFLLKGDGNLWWAGATNLGIDWALNAGGESDYILTLNNDLVVKENYLASLMDSAKSFKDTLIGSLSADLKHPEEINDGGVKINFWTAKYESLNKGKTLAVLDNQPNKHVEVSALSGRGTLIPFTVFKAIGTYNYKQLPHYGADYEFSIRAKNAGFPLMVSYSSILYSHVDETGLDNENRYAFLKYFFNIKSPSSIPQRLKFALCITKNPFMLASYVLFDLTRNILHYCEGISKSKRKK